MIRSRVGAVGSSPAQLQQAIISAATAQGVNPTLALAVAQQESGLNPSAVSSAGAIGIFQLMPATAAQLGVNPYDTSQNIQGGVAYLKQQLDSFGGDTSLALAAYNAGPGAVRQYGGIPPYPETQNYVSSILASVGSTPPDASAAASGDDGSIPVDSIVSWPDLSSITSQTVDLSAVGLPSDVPSLYLWVGLGALALLALSR